jgi:PIN domain nuclease of toxin-antitoxin system
MKLLLDTCTFLWIATGDASLSASARKFFSDPANDAFLSSVSAWEIAVKHSLGKLPLPRPPSVLVPEERQRHQIQPLALDEAAALFCAKLPELHKDPFDRMLICQAIIGGLTLLTPDPLVTQYPVATVW